MDPNSDMSIAASKAATTTSGASTMNQSNRKLKEAGNLLFGEVEEYWGRNLAWIGTVVGLLQTAALLVNPHWVWGNGASGLGVPLYMLIIPTWDPNTRMAISSYLEFQSIVWITFTVVLYWVLHLGVLVWRVTRQKSRFGISFFSAVSQLIGSGVLFLPMLHTLLADVVCDSGSNHLANFPTKSCWTDAVVGVHFAAALAALLALGVINLLTTFFFVDDLSLSSHPKARSHGYADFAEQATVITLAILYHVMIPSGQLQAFTSLVAAFSAAVVLVYALFLPYYEHLTNQIKCVAWSCIFGVAVLMSGLHTVPTPTHGDPAEIISTQEIKDPSSNWDFLLLCCVVVFSALGGYLLANFRVSGTCVSWVRSVACGAGPKARAGYKMQFPAHLPDVERCTFRDLEPLFVGEALWAEEQMAEVERRAHDYWMNTVVYSFLDTVLFETDVEASTRFLVMFDRVTRQPISPAWLTFALRIFTKGMAKYPSSFRVQLDFASFLACFSPSKCPLALKLAESLQNDTNSWTQSHQLAKRLKQIIAAMNLKDNTHRKILGNALRVHRDALGNMTQFWNRLQSEQVDMTRVASIAKNITELREQGCIFFERLQDEGNSDATSTVRYAAFLEQIMMDQDAADTCREYAIQTLTVAAGGSSRGTKTTSAKDARIKLSTTGSTSSDTVVYLSRGLNVSFMLLFCGLLAFGIYGVWWVPTDMGNQLKKVSAAGYARTAAQEAGVLVNRLDRLMAAPIHPTDPVPQEITSGIETLNGRIATLRNLFYAVAFGELKTAAEETSQSWGALRYGSDHDTLSVYSIGVKLISLLESIAGADPRSKLSDTKSRELYILEENVLSAVNSALNHSAVEMERDVAKSAANVEFNYVIILVITTAFLIVAYYLITSGVEMVCRGKLLTLNLFTLIPRATLERLEAENQERIVKFDAPDAAFEDMKAAAGLASDYDVMNQILVEDDGAANPENAANRNGVDSDSDNEEEAFMQSKFAAMAKNIDKADGGQAAARNRLTKGAGNEGGDGMGALTTQMMDEGFGLEGGSPVGATNKQADNVNTGEGMTTEQMEEERATIRRGIEATARSLTAVFACIVVIMLALSLTLTVTFFSRDVPSTILKDNKVPYLASREGINRIQAHWLELHELTLGIMAHRSTVAQFSRLEDSASGLTGEIVEVMSTIPSLNPKAVETLHQASDSWELVSKLQRVALALYCDESIPQNVCDRFGTHQWSVDRLVPWEYKLPMHLKDSTLARADNITERRRVAIMLLGSPSYHLLFDRANAYLTTLSGFLRESRLTELGVLLEDEADLHSRALAIIIVLIIFNIFGMIISQCVDRSITLDLSVLFVLLLVNVATVVVVSQTWDTKSLELHYNTEFTTLNTLAETTRQARSTHRFTSELVSLGLRSSQFRFTTLVQDDSIAKYGFQFLSTVPTHYVSFMAALKKLHDLQEWERIIVRLASDYYGFQVEPIIANTHWNSTLDLRTDTALQFPTQIFPTNHTHDLALNGSVQLQLITELTFGPLLTETLAAELNNLENLQQIVIDEEDQILTELVGKEKIIVTAARVLALILFAGEIVLVASIFHKNFKNALTHGSSDESTTYRQDELFIKLSLRSRAALSAIFVCLLCCLTVGYASVVDVEHAGPSQNAATSRGLSVAVSMGYMQRTLLKHSDEVDTLWTKWRILVESTSDLLFSTSRDKIGPAMEYPDVTAALLGSNSYASRRRFECPAAPSYVVAPASNETFAHTLLHSVEVGVHMWEHLLDSALQIPYQNRSAQIAILEDSQLSLNAHLRTVSVAYDNDLQLKIERNRIILLIFSLFFLAALILLYTSVFRPMIGLLSAEEEGGKMMLKMIPERVRDSVPAIAEYIATGVVSLDTKLQEISDAAGHLSTLPVIAIDGKGSIIRYSKAAEETFQWAESEVMGKNVNLLMRENVAVEHDFYLWRYRRTGVKRVLLGPMKVRAMRKDRSTFPAEITIKEHKAEGKTFFIGSLRNITLDSEFERATVLSKAVSEAATIPIIVISEEGMIQRFNSAAENAFKYQSRDVLGKNLKMLMTQADADHHDEYLATYKKTRVKHVVDQLRNVTCKRSNGETFPGQLNIRELIRPDGSVFIGYILDQTQRLHFQMATMVNDAIANTSPIPVIEIDELGSVITWSPSAAQTFGVPAREMVGKNIKMIMPDEISVKHDGILANYLKTGRKKVIDAPLFKATARRRGDDGSWTPFPVAMVVSEVRHRSGRTYIAYLRDIAKENEELLANRTASLVASLTLRAIVIINQIGTILSYSRHAVEIFGYEPDEALGKNIKTLTPPNVAKYHDQYLKNYLSTRERSVIGNVRREKAVRKDGRMVSLELLVSEIPAELSEDTGGQVGGSLYVAFIKDATQEEELEKVGHVNRALMRLSSIPVIVADIQGKIKNVSDSCCETFSYSRSEMIGSNLTLIQTEADAKHHHEYLQRFSDAVETKGFKQGVSESSVVGKERKLTGKTRDEQTFPVKLNVRAIQIAGQPPLLVGAIRNCTEETKFEFQQTVSNCIIDQGDIPCICMDSLGIVSIFSTAAEKLWGYSRDEVEGQNIKMIQPPDVARVHDGYLRAYLKTGTKSVIDSKRQVISVKKDGTEFRIELQIQELVRLVSGQEVKEYVGFVRDLTEEFILVQANSINAAVSSLSIVPIIKINGVGEIKEFNNAAQREFMYTEEEAVGGNIKNFVMQDDVAAKHDGYLAAYHRTGKKTVIDVLITHTGQRKDLSDFPVELMVREVTRSQSDAAASIFIAYIVNISTRLALQKDKLISAAQVETAGDPLICITSAGIITIFSAAASRCWGYEQSEVIGKNLKMLMPEAIAENHDEYLDRYMRTRVKTIVDKPRAVVGRHKSGRPIHGVATIKEIIDALGVSTFLAYFQESTHLRTLTQLNQITETAMFASSNNIILIDSETLRVLALSSGAQQLLGYTQDEVVGKPLSMLEPATMTGDGQRMATKSAVKEDLEAKVSGVNAGRQSAVKCKDGAVIRTRSFFYQTDPDRTLGSSEGSEVALQFINIEPELNLERVSAEGDALREMVATVVLALDLSGNVQTCNTAVKVLGYDQDQIQGRPFVDLFATAADFKSLLEDFGIQEGGIVTKNSGKSRVYKVKPSLDAVNQQPLTMEISCRPLEVDGAFARSYVATLSDISATQNSRKLLAVNTEVQATNPVATVCFDATQQILRYSPAAEELFGGTEAAVRGSNVSTLLMAEGTENRISAFVNGNSAEREKLATQAPVQTKHADGRLLRVDLGLSEVRADDSEEVIAFVAFFTAIENVREVSTEIAKFGPEVSVNGFVVADDEGVIEEINPRAMELFGIANLSQAIGVNVKAIMPQEVAVHHDGYLRAMRKTGKGKMINNKRKVHGLNIATGKLFPLEVMIRELKVPQYTDGEKVKKEGDGSSSSSGWSAGFKVSYIAYITDLSQQERQEQLQATMNVTLSLSTEAIIVITTHGIVLSFNPTAELMLGVPANDVIGKNVKMLMPDAVAVHHDQYLGSYLETGVSHIINTSRKTIAKRSDGGNIDITIRVKEIKSGENQDTVYAAWISPA